MFLLNLLLFFILFPFRHPKLYFVFTIINAILSLFIYISLKPYYVLKNGQDIHAKYPEFKRNDNLSFIRLFIGFMTLAWPRAILFLFTMWLESFVLLIGDVNNKKLKDPFYKGAMRFILFCLGCVIPTIEKRDEKCKEVYAKYLGKDYKLSYDKKFATVIGNHCSFIDAFFYGWQFACSYISKKTASKVPLIRTIAIYNKTLYLDRTNEEDRHKVADEISNRQRNILSGEFNTQLCIFPEGTITNGKYIIKFKRGAFMALLPLKPMIELIEHNPIYELSTGVLPMHFHLIYALCFLYIPVTFISLPIIEPTEYMYEHYADLGKEKWQIYMEVTRKIMSEVSGLPMSDVNFPEKLEYMSLIKGKKVKNT